MPCLYISVIGLLLFRALISFMTLRSFSHILEGIQKGFPQEKCPLLISVHLPPVAAHKVPDKRGSILKLRGRDASPAVVGEDVICRKVLTLTEKLSEHSHDFLSVHI